MKRKGKQAISNENEKFVVLFSAKKLRKEEKVDFNAQQMMC